LGQSKQASLDEFKVAFEKQMNDLQEEAQATPKRFSEDSCSLGKKEKNL